MERSLTRDRPEMTSVPWAMGMSGFRKRLSGPRCPTRSSVTWEAAPEDGFWWHSRQDCALYKGPSPPLTFSVSSNLAWSAWCVVSSTMPLLLLSNPVGASADGIAANANKVKQSTDTQKRCFTVSPDPTKSACLVGYHSTAVETSVQKD